MATKCEFCGEITQDEDTVYCKKCGYRYEKTEIDVLKNINLQLTRNNETAKKQLKNQIKIAYVTLLIAIGAFLLALVAACITTLTLPQDQRYAGIVLIIFSGLLFGYFVNKYRISPIAVDEIEE